MIHGGYGSAQNAETDYGWDGQADADRFVVAYPDGVGHAWNVGGGCCGTPGRDQIDDVAFLTQMVTTIGHEVPIDPARIYATGISNGGLMAYRLACDTDVFAAIGPDSATLMGTCPSPAPVSVIHIHGLSDDRIPFTGGKGTGFATVVDGPPVPTVVAMWRSVDGCAAPTVTTAGVVTTSVATCPSGRAVELITITGAGHQWPGGKSPRARSVGSWAWTRRPPRWPPRPPSGPSSRPTPSLTRGRPRRRLSCPSPAAWTPRRHRSARRRRTPGRRPGAAAGASRRRTWP